MSIPPKLEVDELPELSEQVALTAWPVPALVTVTATGLVPLEVVVEVLEGVRLRMPEAPVPGSVHEKVTVTCWLVVFPDVYGPDGTVADVVRTGARLSILTTTLCGDSAFPARSVAKKEIVVVPLFVIGTVVWLPGTAVSDSVCPPVSL